MDAVVFHSVTNNAANCDDDQLSGTEQSANRQEYPLHWELGDRGSLLFSLWLQPLSVGASFLTSGQGGSFIKIK